jgi:hypothetical protein
MRVMFPSGQKRSSETCDSQQFIEKTREAASRGGLLLLRLQRVKVIDGPLGV